MNSRPLGHELTNGPSPRPTQVWIKVSFFLTVVIKKSEFRSNVVSQDHDVFDEDHLIEKTRHVLSYSDHSISSAHGRMDIISLYQTQILSHHISHDQ